MLNDDLRDLYQQVILDHSRQPRNFGELGAEAVHVHGDNPSCGDEIDLWVHFGEDGKVADIRFSGQGCAISQASASMMTVKVKGKPRAHVEELLTSFRGLVLGQDLPENEALGELQLLEGVQKFPQRVKCAMLAWRALEQALGDGGTATTE